MSDQQQYPQYVRNMTSGFDVPEIPTTLTGYQMHLVVNELLGQVGLTKRIPPQMMYNYLKKGYVTKETFPTWVMGYIQKSLKKV